ncbi:hypothetical protein RirG_123930 [Rhizophagus irregularis DAOM 197198w]|uniref:Uncharacterized protein n=1 Tax=Rhizophagus irregularis (strain DAOM 197198w) TaxID=1432141 RepID=A0A015MHS6_RHIIW|nr:hypothetical protein RirG_123930 [Rhizophagus irregularis DAOM 197198w]
MNKGRRKRIAANILDEYNNPSSSTSERTYAKFTTRKPRSKVPCYCSNCNRKMIDPRTKERHEQTNSLELLNSDKAPMSQELVELIDSTISLEEPQDTTISLVEPQDTTIPLVEPQDTTISIDIYSDNDTYEQQQYVFLPRKKRSKTGTLHHITEVEQVAESTEYDTDDIYTSESSAQEDSPNNDDNEFSSNFENYSHPMFDIPDISDTPNISELPTDELIKGILIWIMKFRSSHNIPNTAIEELIQFIKIILKVCKNINPESFPNSLYMLRKR